MAATIRFPPPQLHTALGTLQFQDAHPKHDAQDAFGRGQQPALVQHEVAA